MWLRLLLKQEYQTKPHARTRASIKTHAHTYNLRFSGRQRRRGFSVRGAYPTYANESSQTHPRARGLQLSHRSRRFGCLRARNKISNPVPTPCACAHASEGCFDDEARRCAAQAPPKSRLVKAVLPDSTPASSVAPAYSIREPAHNRLSPRGQLDDDENTNARYISETDQTRNARAVVASRASHAAGHA